MFQNKNVVINKNDTLHHALIKLSKISNLSKLILFVTNDNNQIIGSVTDGDVRRALIENKNLNKKVGDICNRKFLFLEDSKKYVSLKKIKKSNPSIKILPVLNKNGQLVRIIDLKSNNSILPLECVIMAGGRGKRLSPLTDNVPKPMLMLGNKPIIEHNIDRLIKFGISKIYISLNYLGQQIEDYFGDGSKKGIEIVYVREKDNLGTAGALSLINDIKSKHLLLLNGDLLTNVNFEEMYSCAIENHADFVVASKDYKINVPYAIFESENFNIKSFKEKPTYTYYSNAGVYIFKSSLIEKIPKNKFFDITDLIVELISNNYKLMHIPINGYWVDIGNPDQYKNAQELVKHLN
tara:strand:- start:2975 stop:4027 length:1053 start_codon:yes stop_codon:yes gene_type:complete